MFLISIRKLEGNFFTNDTNPKLNYHKNHQSEKILVGGGKKSNISHITQKSVQFSITTHFAVLMAYFFVAPKITKCTVRHQDYG